MKITPHQFAWIFLIVLVVLIGLGGFAVYNFFSHPASSLISVEQEEKLGEMLDDYAAGKLNENLIIHDAYMDSCLHEIESRLLDAIGKTDYRYRFGLIRNPEPNAFAIPGARIYIHSGLIEFCETPEELAAVLAHEMGHTEHRHGINNIMKQLGADAIMAYLTDGNSGALEQISGQMVSTYFSREDEIEADDFALKILERAGIRPATLGIVFSRMKEEHGDMTGVLNMLSTHPELEQRSSKAAAYVTGSSFAESRFEMDWTRVKQRLGDIR